MKNLKSIFGGKNVIFEKDNSILKNKKSAYIIDTFDDELYRVVDSENPSVHNVLDATELRNLVEGDNKNTYTFTKEAYTQCEMFFSRIKEITA